MKINIITILFLILFLSSCQQRTAEEAKSAADWKERIEAVEKLEPDRWQDLLADISVNDKAEYVREAAVEKLDPEKWQDLLLDIALNNTESFNVREAAIEKITDKNTVADIARNNSASYIRKVAVDNLALDKWEDLLVDIALNDAESLNVRKAAIEKISDKNIITDIAENANSIRKAAVENLDPDKWQNLLVDIAKNDEESFSVRKAAIEKITDKSIIAGIAKNDIHHLVRQFAYQKLGLKNSQEALVDIAKNSRHEHLRNAAIKKITDQNSLADIVINRDESWEVRESAFEKITDKESLVNIALNANDNNFDKSALEKLNPKLYEEVIYELYNFDENEQSILNNITKLNNSVFLTFLAYYFPHQTDFNGINGVAKIKHILIDHCLRKYYKDLVLIVTRVENIGTYVGGRVISVDYNIKIINENKTVIFKKYKGPEFDEVELISSRGEKYKRNKIDVSEICKQLLKPFKENDLKNIINTSKNIYLRQEAYKRLGLENSNEALVEIVEHKNIYPYNRYDAVSKLNDQAYLANLAKDDNDRYIRIAAVEKLNPDKWQELLTDIAKNDEKSSVRITAVKKLTDQEILADIAENNEYSYVREAAKRRLEELKK